MANPTFIGMEVADSGGTAQATLVCNIHASALAGDLAVMMCGNDEGSNAVQFDATTNKPSGSTFVDTDGNSTSDSHYGVFWKELTSGDISTGSITFIAASSNQIFGWVRVYRDFNLSNVINVLGTSVRLGTVDNFMNLPAVTTNVNDCIVLGVGAHDGGDTNAAWSGTDWTELSELHSGTGGTDAMGTIGHNVMTGQGTSNVATITFDVNDGKVGVQFAIEPGSDGGSPSGGRIMSSLVRYGGLAGAGGIAGQGGGLAG